MHHYYHWPIDLPYQSTNFYRGSKSAIFGIIAQQRSILSLCSLETEQGIFIIFKFCLQWLSGNIPTTFGADRSTRFYRATMRSIYARYCCRDSVFAKLSMTQPGIVRFRSNLVQTMTTCHQIYHELSRSTGHSVTWRIRRISVKKNRHISWTDSLTEFKLCVKYLRA